MKEKNLNIKSTVPSVLLVILFLIPNVFCSEAPVNSDTHGVKASRNVISNGIWVTVFSKKEILYSRDAVLNLVEFCKKKGINEIYLQIFRSGEAYFDSNFLPKNQYAKMTAKAGADTIDYLLKEAKKNGIKVFAWVNVLSLAQNKEAPILKKYGASVLTRDRHLRVSIRTEEKNESDKFYLRDDQLFLEPGDERVVEFIMNVVRDILERYPNFDGIHLDYVRYPYPVPFTPDSRFLDYGVSYGFGENNVKRFKKEYGLDPSRDNPYQNDLHLKWDNWKREQITVLVEKISRFVRSKAKSWRISCAVVPGFERAYSIAYQDWPLWLKRGLIDYVVLMNYTRDERLFAETIKSSLNSADREKIFVGIGAFLLRNSKEMKHYYEIIRKLKPGGIVFFSYDDVCSPEFSVNDK